MQVQDGLDKAKENRAHQEQEIPVSALSSRQQVMDPTNLVVCCKKCNVEKSNKYSYEEFLAIKKEGYG